MVPFSSHSNRRRSAARLASRSKRNLWITSWLLFFFALGFYLYTLQPSLAWGDGTRLQREVLTGQSYILGEMEDIDFAYDPFPFARLGIAAWDHPLYVVLGHTLVRIGTSLFPQVGPLRLVNLISAVFGAGTIAVFFAICYTQSSSWFGAALGAAALIVSHTFWWHSTTAEVYTLHTFLILSCLAALLAYLESAARKHLYLSAFALGLATSNHFLAILMIPSLLIFLVWTRDSVAKIRLSDHRAFGLTLAAFLCGLLVLLVQGVRMVRTFAAAELIEPFLGSTFFQNLAPISPFQSLLLYLLFLSVQFSIIGLVLGLIGARVALRANPIFARLVLSAFCVFALFSISYRVVDQFAFHLSSYVLFALGIPFGLQHLRERWPAPLARSIFLLFGALILMTPLVLSQLPDRLRSLQIDETAFGIPQIGTGVRDGLRYYLDPNKRADDQAYRFGEETLMSLPADSIVIAQWYTDTEEYFVFRYFAEVEKLRPDVEIVGWPLEDPFQFDNGLALALVDSEVPERHLFLSSLSERYYAASLLVEKYCIVPANNLYQVKVRADHQTATSDCLDAGDIPAEPGPVQASPQR